MVSGSISIFSNIAGIEENRTRISVIVSFNVLGVRLIQFLKCPIERTGFLVVVEDRSLLMFCMQLDRTRNPCVLLIS